MQKTAKHPKKVLMKAVLFHDAIASFRFTAAPGAVRGVMLFLLPVFVFRSLLESRQSLVPEMGKVIAQQRDAFRV